MKTDFWTRVKELRDKKGVSIKDMCAELDWNYGTFTNLITQGAIPDSYRFLKKMADYFGVSIEYLVEGNKEKTQNIAPQINLMSNSHVYHCTEMPDKNHQFTFRVIVDNAPDGDNYVTIEPLIGADYSLRSTFFSYPEQIIDIKTEMERKRIHNAPLTLKDALKSDMDVAGKYAYEEYPAVIASAIRCAYAVLDKENNL
jgi:transcriptional regulator with XRE-family HTH domain